MSALQPLKDMAKRGMQPSQRIVWLRLGITPPKRNAIKIDPDNLPSDSDCAAVAGLDVILCLNGYVTRYGTVKRLCESLMLGRPRRLQLIDHDYKKIAYLKLGGVA